MGKLHLAFKLGNPDPCFITPLLNRDYNRDPNFKALKRRGSTLGILPDVSVTANGNSSGKLRNTSWQNLGGLRV